MELTKYTSDDALTIMASADYKDDDLIALLSRLRRTFGEPDQKMEDKK